MSGVRQDRFGHGGDIYRRRVTLDFSVNGNPLGVPETVRRVMEDPWDYVCAYPDPECEGLKRALAERDGIPVSQIIVTNGASEMIRSLAAAVRPRSALILTPAFSEYERTLLTEGSRVCFASGTEAFLRKMGQSEMAFLCNPANPTGQLLDPLFVQEAADEAERCGTVLVLDECFLRFCPDFSERTFRRRLFRRPHLVILDSFTKIYNLAGLRLGFGLAADARLRKSVGKKLPLWNVSSLAQAAGAAALAAEGYVEETLRYLAEERGRMRQELASCGMTEISGEADFLFFASPAELFDPLLAGGILIRDCGNYRGLDRKKRYYRAAVRTREEDDILLDGIRAVLAEGGR